MFRPINKNLVVSSYEHVYESSRFVNAQKIIRKIDVVFTNIYACSCVVDSIRV